MNEPQATPLELTTWLAPLEETTQQLWSEILLCGQEYRRLLFTGVNKGDGATTMAAVAALGLARNLRRPTLLIETNARAPALGRFLGASGPGFAEFCRGDVPGGQTIWQSDCPLLHVMTAGAMDNQDGLFAGQGAVELLNELSGVYERVVMDSAPVLSHPDTLLLVQESDAVVLVARAGHTEEADLRAAVARLEATNVPILGTVLNHVRERVPRWLQPPPEGSGSGRKAAAPAGRLGQD